MLSVKEAWRELSTVFPKDAIETVTEIEDAFVFCTRPKTRSCSDVIEMICYFVSKETGLITEHSILDHELYDTITSKDYDPVTLKEI